jgi:NAD(P)-dependent dehydrogenase (short-subunit alcohol dehydrogenase family)
MDGGSESESGTKSRRRAGVMAAGAALALGQVAREAMARSREADLRGSVALVTGGSRGLGLAISRELARQGCRLAICARDEAELAEARRDLEARGAEVLTVPCDVADQDHVSAMVEVVTRRYGRIDVLVNNAGIMVVAPFETLTHADFERVMAIDFWGMVNPTLAVLPGMRARGAGRIVNITSIGGKVAVPHMLPYTSAKFATVGFSTGLRAEVADAGIVVTTVVPGLMRTGSYLHAEFGGDQEAEYRWFALDSSAPYPVATSAERAARMIVRAARRGQAECMFPISAVIVARLSGLLPGATANALALVDRLMPEPPRHLTRRAPGAAVERGIDEPVFHAATTLGRAAAEEYHQTPPTASADATEATIH